MWNQFPVYLIVNCFEYVFHAHLLGTGKFWRILFFVNYYTKLEF